jgi:parallel beta-helix repeat protein
MGAEKGFSGALALTLVAVLLLGFVSFIDVSPVVCSSPYTPHGPIYINGNDDFTSANGVVNPGASGTEWDPYIIEGWRIEWGLTAIEIHNTTAYFVIKNCFLIEYGGCGEGIKLGRVVNGKINNVTVKRFHTGIHVKNSRNNIILNSTVKLTAGEGIHIEASSNNIIENCTLFDLVCGVELDDSDNNVVRDCTIGPSGCGFHLESSYNNRIYHNKIKNTLDRAYDDGSNQWDDGYPSSGNYWGDYTGWDHYQGENQDMPGSDGIGDMPYEILPYGIPGGTNQDRYPFMKIVSISPYYQSGLPGETLEYTITVTNLGDVEDTYNLEVSGGTGWAPVLDDYWLSVGAGSSATTTLSVTILPGTDEGNSTNVTVTATSQTDPSVSDSDSCTTFVTLPEGVPHDPICIEDDSEFTLEDQITLVDGVIAGSGAAGEPYVIGYWVIDASASHGIKIRDTTAYFVIRNCLVENGRDSHYGIYLRDVINGRIANNTCFNNTYGIRLRDSSNNTLTNNTCKNNYVGIILSFSDNNIVDSNICENNNDGIVASGTAKNNTIHHNYLFNNTNAWDDGSNYWDNGSEGNWWSDWQPPEHPDADGDGIVDENRPIADEGNQDRYPLVIIQGSPEVSISPSQQKGISGENLTYIVTVTNIGFFEETYDLIVSDNAGWSLSISPTSLTLEARASDTVALNVTIPVGTPPDTIDKITVTATLQENSEVSDSENCWCVTCPVRVYIDPVYQSGLPGESVENYTVTVVNNNTLADTYTLESWGYPGWALSLDDTSLTIPAGENRQTTLRVTVPSGSVGVLNPITVSATGAGGDDNARCFAYGGKAEITGWGDVIPWASKNVQVDVDFLVGDGSELVVAFYAYNGTTLLDENIIAGGVRTAKTASAVRNPGDEIVRVARIVLKSEEGDRILSKRLKMCQNSLRDRYIEILIAWAGCPPCQPDFRDELIAILIRLASAPSDCATVA